MISGYATFVGQRQFQLVIFHDQVLFGLFDPIFRPNSITAAAIEHNTIGPTTGVLTLFLFVTNLVAMSLVFSLTVWQMKLITKGQTCVEEKIDKSVMTNSALERYQRPYDLGWKQNWKTFFQIDNIYEGLIRFFIPFPFHPKHDGTQWMTKHNE